MVGWHLAALDATISEIYNCFQLESSMLIKPKVMQMSSGSLHLLSIYLFSIWREIDAKKN
jgi:hypothetical protein